MGQVTYSINGFRRNLADKLKELKRELDYEIEEGTGQSH